MADDSTPERQPWVAPSKDVRKAERARIIRTSRLPFLYDYALRGRREAVLAAVVQTLVPIVLGLLAAQALTGRWLPPGVAIGVLAIGVALQMWSRYANARAGRQ